MRGNDIFVGSSQLPAVEFAQKKDDDIELINYVESLGPNTARLWHSSNIPKDGMMWRAITSVLNNKSRSTGYGLAFLKEHADEVEFLGFVNMYTMANTERTIQAFNVIGMVLFHFSSNTMELGSLVVARKMRNSSMQERLIQIVQILQLRRHNRAHVQFSIPSSNSEAKYALKSAGFACVPIEKEDEFAVSGKKIVIMAKCSFAQIWMKHHSSISMPDEDPPLGNPRFIEAVIAEIFKGLTSHPFNLVPKEQAALCVARVNSLLRKGHKKLLLTNQLQNPYVLP